MENKIRVLHVAQAAGGVDRYLRLLLKYLDKDKFDNIVILSQDFKKSDYEGLVFAFEQVEMTRVIGKKDLIAISEVRHLIKKYQPDIVYAHSSKAGAIARIADIGIRNQCIYNPHGWAFNMQCGKKKQIIYALIERISAPFCDKIICISEAEKQSALRKRICSEEKLQVILNGVDVEEYERSKMFRSNVVNRVTFGIPDDAFVIGMVGRISRQKAPDVFIRAAKEIQAKIPNAYFIIVGDGPDRKKVEEYAIKNHISLFVTGWVENTFEYVDLFDIALLLSRWEGFGLVLPEYMLSEKPIIATEVDAIPEIIIDGKNGILIKPDDENKVTEAVLKLYCDKTLKFKLCYNEVITVREKFDVKRTVSETEKLLETLVKVCDI